MQEIVDKMKRCFLNSNLIGVTNTCAIAEVTSFCTKNNTVAKLQKEKLSPTFLAGLVIVQILPVYLHSQKYANNV